MREVYSVTYFQYTHNSDGLYASLDAAQSACNRKAGLTLQWHEFPDAYWKATDADGWIYVITKEKVKDS